MGNIIDIQSTGGHISGHQDTKLAPFEAIQRLGPCPLTLIAMDGCAIDPGGLQFFNHSIGNVLHLSEHDGFIDCGIV